MIKVKRTERGWAGHFICAHRCRFRRNTLLEHKNKKIVVSTVGLMESPHNEDKFEVVGLDRYYETMAFHSNPEDKRYHDADVHNEISFDSDWAINELDADDKANKMHEKVIDELIDKLLSGKIEENNNK